MSVFIGYPSFMAYQMMKGKKGNNDGFPSIPGMIARYSALGLTNEEMSKNPVWVDKTGNGHDLQMKNFIWGGMSGVGGYNQNFNQYFVGVDESNKTVSDSSMKLVLLESDSQKVIYDRNTYQIGHTYNFYIKVTGIEGRMLNVNAGTLGGRIMSITEDGIYSINVTVSDSWGQNRLYLIFPPSSSSNTVTIEQLPLYPGALVFDGVADYGTCDNFPILTKEKGYTVVALRSYLAESIGYLVYNGTSAKQSAFAFERSDSLDTWSWGINSFIRNSLPKLMSYQTSNSYNNNIISTGTAIEGDKLIRIASVGGYSNVAIWELVFLDHDATEEELTKIKDYFVKTYPWLFPDQAWTVVGKTNEDEDRATIANITGNGNNLVLSNFGFAENSGYGDYPISFPSSLSEGQPYGTLRFKTDGKYSNLIKTGVTNIRIKFNLRGMPEGGVLSIMGLDPTTALPITEKKSYTVDGLYEFVYNDSAKPVNIVFYNDTLSTGLFDFYVDIIPEYEGYLVTDGVDDKIQSSNFPMGKDFTIVGEWRLISVSGYNYAGIIKSNNLYVYNNASTGLNIYVCSSSISNYIHGVKSLKAIRSDGRVYDENWAEYKLGKVGNNIGANSTLDIGTNKNNFTKIAFKNLEIYNNKILSKEDCIKAYSYLQTLKAKI